MSDKVLEEFSRAELQTVGLDFGPVLKEGKAPFCHPKKTAKVDRKP